MLLAGAGFIFYVCFISERIVFLSAMPRPIRTPGRSGSSSAGDRHVAKVRSARKTHRTSATRSRSRSTSSSSSRRSHVSRERHSLAEEQPAPKTTNETAPAAAVSRSDIVDGRTLMQLGAQFVGANIASVPYAIPLLFSGLFMVAATHKPGSPAERMVGKYVVQSAIKIVKQQTTYFSNRESTDMPAFLATIVRNWFGGEAEAFDAKAFIRGDGLEDE